jgi:hypothetical protein
MARVAQLVERRTYKQYGRNRPNSKLCEGRGFEPRREHQRTLSNQPKSRIDLKSTPMKHPSGGGAFERETLVLITINVQGCLPGY